MDQRQSVAVAIAFELTDLLSETIAAAPVECPQCAAAVIERPT
jgi:hypothetical protein